MSGEAADGPQVADSAAQVRRAMAGLPLRQLREKLTARLAGVGIDQPDREVMILLQAAVNHANHANHADRGREEAPTLSLSDMRKHELFGDSLTAVLHGPELAQSAVRWLDSAVARRVEHEPLQYITGSAPFMNIDVCVGPGVFVPRVETELMVADALGWLKTHLAKNTAGAKHDAATQNTAGVGHIASAGRSASAHSTACARPIVCDLCSGSGAIALAIATDPAIHGTVFAIEKDAHAWEWLQKNVAQAQRSGRLASAIRPVHADAMAADLLHDFAGRVDCIVCNPPYLPLARPVEQQEAQADPNIALYGGSNDGMAIPRAIISVAAGLLRHGGALFMEHDITQGAAMRAAFKAAGFVDIATCDDDTHRPRWTRGVRS